MFYSISLFLLLLSSYIYADKPKSTADETIIVDLINAEDFRHLFSRFDEPVLLTDVTFESDAEISASELQYLTDFKKSYTYSLEDFANACLNVKQKNKLSSASFIFSREDEGWKLHLNFKGLWTFNKATFQGLLSGNDAYKNYYLLDVGERFDIEKHRHSLKKIEEVFQEEGYFNGKVIDYLNYNSKNKTVDVSIALDRGFCFVIDELHFYVADPMERREKVKLLTRLNKQFSSELKNKYFSQDLLKKQTKELKYYLNKKGYVSSEIRLKQLIDHKQGTVQLYFILSVHQKKSYVFFGNHAFSSKKLREIVFSFGRCAVLMPESILEREIAEAYQKKGFWHASIQVQEEESRCYFIINEGVRSKVKKVEFEGLDTIDEAELRPYFKSFCGQKYFDGDLLKQSLQECGNYFLQHGYLEAKILKQDYIPLDKPDQYKSVVLVEEGPQFMLGKVEIENHSELMKHDLFSYKRGETPFDSSKIQQQRQWLMDYFQSKGCLYVQVMPELQYEDTTVNLFWNINGADEPLIFGKAIVQGACSFPMNNVLRELEFREGEVWKKEKIERTLGRLRKLGIFETIQIYPYQVATPEGQKSIIIKLQEDDPFEVRFRAGVEQVSKNFTFRKGTTYKFGGSFLYKNPFNEGGFFRGDFDITRFYRYLSAQYKRPWILNQPISTLLKGYSNKFKQPVRRGSEKTLYQATQEGFLVGFFRYWDYVDIGLNIGFEAMETNDLSLDMARAINFETDLVDKKIPYFFFEPSLSMNYLDDQLNPTRGFLTIVILKSMIPFRPDVASFFKVIFDQAFFIPIMPLVMGIRLRFGHIFNQDFNTIMPPERFYLGGPNSIRSYIQNFVPPLGSFIDEKGKRQLVPQGGRTMVNFNLEFRFPIWRNLGGVVFQDMGMLIEKSFTEAIMGNRFVAGTGFGFRYKTPVGPLRFDLGIKWRRQDPDQGSFAWFLTLGQAF